MRFASLLAVLSIAAVTPRVKVAGDYASNWDDIHLEQKGDHVTGSYVCCGGGTIDGRIIENQVIKFEWDEPRGAGHGRGIWVIRGNRLEGTWGHGESADDGGPWNLERKAAIAN